MFIKDGKRFNIYASGIFDGVRYVNFTDGGVQAKLGIQWIPDPAPPEDYSEDTYYRQEIDEAPYVVYTPKSAEQIEAARTNAAKAVAAKYLADTDWYVTRFIETGKAIPDTVTLKREEARACL